MKLVIGSLLLLLLAAFALAAEKPQKQVIVSYPKNTPASILDDAKKAVLDAGGVILHEYNIIVAFAAKVPTTVLEGIKTAGADHNVLIEEDQTVTINN